MSESTPNIGNMSPAERLQLLEQLWESLRSTPDAVPLTEAQRNELDRRLDEFESDGGGGIPWEDVFQRIRGGAK